MPKVAGEYFQWQLRTYFCDFLTIQPEYQEVVEQLQPMWHDVLHAPPGIDPDISYENLTPLAGTHAAIGSYITALHTTVGDTLRCREKGIPARWVCDRLRASVNASFPDPLPAWVPDWLHSDPGYPAWTGSVELYINAEGYGYAIGMVDGQMLTTEKPAVDRLIQPADSGTPFQQWSQLRKQAREELGRVLDEMQQQQEAATRDWPCPQQRGRETRTHKTMSKLVRWIVGRDSLFSGDREAAHRLLRELGLDQP